jgi:hypothetical protein
VDSAVQHGTKDCAHHGTGAIRMGLPETILRLLRPRRRNTGKSQPCTSPTSSSGAAGAAPLTRTGPAAALASRPPAACLSAGPGPPR